MLSTTLAGKYWSLVADNLKTVEIRLADAKRETWKEGVILEVANSEDGNVEPLHMRIIARNEYESFEEALKNEDIRNKALPGMDLDCEGAVDLYRSISSGNGKTYGDLVDEGVRVACFTWQKID